MPWLTLVGVLLLGLGCAAAPVQQNVRVPDEAPAQRTKVDRDERREPPPVHTAPPPAYGNRVVMATEQAETRVN